MQKVVSMHQESMASVCVSWHTSLVVDILSPCSFTRVGCMILLVHDVCDVLMEAAKMCKYCGQEVRPPASYFPLFRALQRALLLFPSAKGVRQTHWQCCSRLDHAVPHWRH